MNLPPPLNRVFGTIPNTHNEEELEKGLSSLYLGIYYTKLCSSRLLYYIGILYANFTC